MSRQLAGPAAWLLLLAAAVALSVAAALRDTLPGDTATLEWLQEQPAPGQRLTDFVRALTTTQAAIGVGLGAGAVAALTGRRDVAVAIAVVVVVLPFLQAGIKDIVDRPRPAPPVAEIRASITSPSYPAGHVMSGAVAWAAVSWAAGGIVRAGRLRWAVWAVCAAVIALSAPANVWAGVHWPSDVVAGYLWAAVLLLPAWLAVRARRVNR